MAEPVSLPVARFVAMRRLQGMAADTFLRHWRHVHGPLMASIPGISYVQNRVAIAAVDGPAVDGFAWVEMPPRLTPNAAAAAAVAGQDLANFVGASTRLMCRMRNLMPQQLGSGWKIMQVHQARAAPADGLGAEAAYLNAVARIPGLAGCRHSNVVEVLPVTSHTIIDLNLRASCVTELWFADFGIAAAVLSSGGWAEVRTQAAAMGCDPADYVVEEIRLA